MNNIEFIDKNIEKCKELIKDIENTSDELKGLYDEEEIIKARAEMKERVIEQLKQLEEIKNILEAWEVVKDYSIVRDDVILMRIDEEDDEFETMKKTLEVEDE